MLEDAMEQTSSALAPLNATSTRIAVVLVEPQDFRNVGAAARAIGNFGAHDLVLVNPGCELEKALPVACASKPIIQQARIVTSLAEGLAPYQRAVAFSNRSSNDRPPPVMLPAWTANFINSPSKSVALVFGTEADGLTTEQVLACSDLVTIPTDPNFSSINLAQAVLLALYELQQAHWRLSNSPSPHLPIPDALESSSAGRPEAANLNGLNQVDRLLDEIMLESGFNRKGTPPRAPQILKHLMRRTAPSERELAILLGFFGRVNRAFKALKMKE